MKLWLDTVPTPVGALTLIVDDDGRLRAAGFQEDHPRMTRELARLGTAERRVDPGGVSTALARYVSGDLDAIRGLPTAMSGTEFQLAVWSALTGIPCGETTSYGALAQRIGRPKAVRAVGLANGANPIAIVVPCHRVIGSDGSLTGYGGGLHRKRWLLAHEGVRGRSWGTALV